MRKINYRKTFLLSIALFFFLLSHAEDFTNSEELNVRAGAGVSYPILGIINSGSTINVIEIDGKWAKINFEGQIGYISTKFITKISNSEQSTSNKDNKNKSIDTKMILYLLGAIVVSLAIRFVTRRVGELFGVKGEEDYKYRCMNCGRYSTRRGHIFKCNSGEHEWFKL